MAYPSEKHNFFTPFKKGKDHILYGKPAWNSGKKMPHSPEWEEKRIAAVREAAKKRVYPRGYNRSDAEITPMRDGRERWRKENPELARQTCLKNLSKSKTTDVSKENSPQWRGGKTMNMRKWRNEHRLEIEKLRIEVLERDNYRCRDCGTEYRPEVHHIIGVSECPSLAFELFNAVTLCRPCHKKTDNFAGKSRPKKERTVSAIFATIPHNWQEYNTVGNWKTPSEAPDVFYISRMTPEMEFCVLVHELVEFFLTQSAGIKEEDISKFDIESGLDDPGASLEAPYHEQHLFAELIERQVAEKIGLDWNEYNYSMDALMNSYRKRICQSS